MTLLSRAPRLRAALSARASLSLNNSFLFLCESCVYAGTGRARRGSHLVFLSCSLAQSLPESWLSSGTQRAELQPKRRLVVRG